MFRKAMPIILLLIVALFFVFAVEEFKFIKITNLTDILIQASVLGLMAIGVVIILISGGVDLSMGSILAFAGVVAAMLLRDAGWPIWAIVIVAMALAAASELVNGFVVTVMKLPPFIATLGTQQIWRGCALIVTGGQPINGLPTSDIEGAFDITWFSTGMIGPVPVPVVILIVALIIFQFMLSKTVLGRHIFATGSNPEAARLSGIKTGRTMRIAYVFGGLLAGLGSIIYIARIRSAPPLGAEGYEGQALTSAIVGGAAFGGGVGTCWGAVCGALLMTTLTNGLTMMYIDTFFQKAFTGLVLVIAVYLDLLQARGGSISKIFNFKKTDKTAVAAGK